MKQNNEGLYIKIKNSIKNISLTQIGDRTSWCSDYINLLKIYLQGLVAQIATTSL